MLTMPFSVRRMRVVARSGVLLRPVRRRQSYLNLLYTLMALPLGITYFTVLVFLISAGLSSVIVLVGIPILLLSFYLWIGLAGFERQLTSWWLDIPITPAPFQPAPGAKYLARLWARLRMRVTWTGLLYLSVKWLAGLFATTVAYLLIALTAGLMSAPVVYLAQLALANGSGAFNVFALSLTLALAALGVGVGVLTLHLGDGMALLWGRFAQVTLGVSDRALRLAEAREIAAHAQAQAARADQSRRELIVNVSHELRTPIASIRGHVESLLLAVEETQTLPPEELSRYLTIVARESERLSALVDDLLSLARAEAGELRLDIQPVAVAGVAREVYEALAPLARRERQVTLVSDIAADLPLILADRQRLTQVLLNLTRNAITYTPVGGIVSLSAERAEPGRLALVVADTGVGIPPEELDRVFERFYRSDSSRARATGGFGLGLAIVRDLVEAMGGRVRVESVVGQGSRFRVLLSLAPAPAPTDSV